MAIDPMIQAILEASPPLPAIWQTPLEDYRGMIDRMSASAPRFHVPLVSVRDESIEAGGVNLKVRVYVPEGGGPHPLLVYFHGGGFTIGDLEISDPICRALASGGECIVVSVDYRLAPEHPFPIPDEDCWNAFKWVLDHLDDLGARSGPVAVGGDSAGATLAARLALTARDAGIQLAAQVLLYPTTCYETDYPSFIEHGDSPVLSREAILFFWNQYLPVGIDRASPAVALLQAEDHGNLAPAFVATAELDPTRDSAEFYGGKLSAAGCDVTVRRFNAMPHGFFSLVAHVPAVQEATDEVTAWLRDHWKSPG